VRILNYISVPKRTQQTRRSTGVIGFRNATLVDPRGRIVAYADRLAIGASAIGMSSATFAPSMLPRLLRGRMPPVTVLEAGRPRLRLNGLQVVLPSGERRLSGGGWACDAAVGTFQRSAWLSVRTGTRKRISG